MLHLNVTLLTVLVGTVLPVLTGLVAKEKSGQAKALLNGLLSAVAGAVTIAIAQGGAVAWQSWLLGIVVVWGSSIVAYHGFWWPTGWVDRGVEWLAGKLAKIGIHLPQSEILTVEDWVKALFGEAVQYLGAIDGNLINKEANVAGVDNADKAEIVCPSDCTVCASDDEGAGSKDAA